MHRAAVAPLLVASLLASLVAADVSTLKSYYSYASSSAVQLISATVLAQNNNGYVDRATVAIGVKSTTSSSFMTDAISFRANTFSELYVSLAIQQLMSTGNLNAGTLPGFMPRGVSLVNSGVTITLQMLLQHQSGLVDSAFDTFTVSAPTAVAAFGTYCDSYFTTTGQSGSFIQATNLFFGLTGNFSRSRMNTVLLTCIMENYVAQNRPSLSGPATALAYMQNLIFAPLGMTNTFSLNATGGFPTSTFPLNAPIYSGSVMQDLPVGSTRAINPGYSGDLMFYTSAADMANFVRSAFINSLPAGAFVGFGNTMRTSMVSSNFVPHQPFVTGQTTYSLFTYNGLEMCKLAVMSAVVTSCPLTSASNVFGYMSVSRFSSLGFFCTTAQSATSPTCITVQFSHYDVGANPTAPVLKQQFEMVLGMAAVAFTTSIGSPQLTLLISGQKSQSDLYGLYVFIAVSGIVIFILVASYITEYLVQPAPISTGLPPPLSLPQHMYPPVSQPPLPRHDFYSQ